MEEPLEAFAARRGFFFRDNFRRLVVVCFLLLILDSCLLGILFYQVYTRTPSKPYVTTSVGDLVELYPANDPDDALLARPVVINDNF